MKSTFTEHYLPNGLRVVCESMPTVRSAAAGFLARTGSRHERRPEHGVSHFLEHMCFKGSAKRDWREINIRFDDLGSIYNAFTGKEHTVYYGWVPKGNIEPQVELLADMMRPSLPPGDFETERNVILEEIAMTGDSFDHHVWNFLHEVLFDQHPLAHEILGEQETIAGLPRDTMVDYHRRRYAADNVTLIASGNIEPEQIFAAAGRYCGKWKRNGTPLDLGTPPVLPTGVRKKQLEQFQQHSVILIYPGVPHNHAAADSIEAFTSLFGGHNSRCYWNIVQKGICTQAGAAWISYADCGFMALFANGEPQRCEEMLAALKAQAQEVTDKGFTDLELKRVRNQRRTQFAVEGENPRTRFMQLVDDLEVYDQLRTVESRLAGIEAVSTASIADYLRKYPITGDGLLLSIGPRDWPA